MTAQTLYAQTPKGIGDAELEQALAASLAEGKQALHKVLLVVPDYTRFHSNAGKIANLYYHMLQDTCQVDILPALGTHVPMTDEECRDMYGDIPPERYIVHNWRTDVVQVGTVPGEYVASVSENIYTEDIDVEINKHLYDDYDLILSIGQVLPHEVVGMANYSKNILVGCGGGKIINASHILGAFYGMERLMGKDHSPVRAVFDYAEKHFLQKTLPLEYVLTVTTAQDREINMHGLFIGKGREAFDRAVALAQKTNLDFVDKPLEKVVVLLDEKEFKSTWLGNKSIYRTRMAIADGGGLIVLAPGVDKFGEDPEMDKLLRKYGYAGREKIIALTKEAPDLQANLSAAAHLIHGSSDGRFSVTYCTRHLTKAEVEGVGFAWRPYDETAARYNPQKLQPGYNTMEDGETIFYIPNPALGLWADKNRF